MHGAARRVFPLFFFLALFPFFLQTLDANRALPPSPAPCSSTPATVGAITGVGMLERRGGFNWRLLGKFAAGWVITIIATVAMTAAFTAQGLYSPNKTAVSERNTVGAYLNATSNQIAAALSSASAATNNATLAAQAANITALTAGQQVPITSLIPAMQTQMDALFYLSNDTAAAAAAL